MSIITANIRYLYGRLGLWWIYLVILGIPTADYFLVAPDSALDVIFMSGIIGSFYPGIIIASIQKEVAAKPFAYCLPGHQQLFRPFVFWVGGVVNAMVGCSFSIYPGLEFPYVLLVMLAGGFTGMAFYFCGVSFAILLDKKKSATAIFMVLLSILFTLFLDEIIKGMQYLIVFHPVIIILAGFAMCVWVWRLLGRIFHLRTYCGKLDEGSWNSWSRKKAETFRQSQILRNLTPQKERSLEGLQTFFLDRMGRSPFLGIGRYIWGTIYTVAGKYFWTQPIRFMLCLFTLMVIAFGFMGDFGVSILYFMVFWVLIMWISSMDLRPVRSVLLPAGRREIFWSILIVSALIALGGAAILVAWVALSSFLQNYLPEFTIHGIRFAFHELPMGSLYFYLLLMPLSLYDAVRADRVKWGGRIIVLFFIFALMDFITEKFILKSLNDSLSPLSIAGLIIAGWVCFVVVLRHICMKRSLTHPDR